MTATDPLPPIEDIDPPPVDFTAELERLIGRTLAAEHNPPDDGAEVVPLTAAAAETRIRDDVRAIIDGLAAPDPAEADAPRPWRVETDDEAEWAMAKLAAAGQQVARIDAQQAAYVDRAARWRARESAAPRRTVAYFTAQLEAWALRRRAAAEQANPARFPKTFRVPSGSVATRGGGDPRPVVVDETILIDWARENLPDLVTVTEVRKVYVATLKDLTAVVDDPTNDGALIVVTRKVTGDGEVIKGTDPVPGVAGERPAVTATVKPEPIEE